jgi:hypothetical protein
LVAGKPLRGGLGQQQGNGFCIAMVNRGAFVSIATTVAQATDGLSLEIIV